MVAKAHCFLHFQVLFFDNRNQTQLLTLKHSMLSSLKTHIPGPHIMIFHVTRTHAAPGNGSGMCGVGFE